MKYLNSAIKWRWLSTMHVFSQDNLKIENGSKKSYAIIPKSAKFVNVFLHKWFPIYGIYCDMGHNQVLATLLLSTVLAYTVQKKLWLFYVFWQIDKFSCLVYFVCRKVSWAQLLKFQLHNTSIVPWPKVLII